MVSAVACICISMMLDGGSLASLLQLPAFIMVIGGTISAVLLQTPFPIFMNGLKMLRWVFFPPKDNAEQVLTDIMDWVRISRRESILALDKVAETVEDPYTRQGLRLVVDGVEASQIRAVLETMIHTREHHEHLSAEIYEAMGGYAPTVGILGAVLGLITVMANLGDPAKLGAENADRRRVAAHRLVDFGREMLMMLAGMDHGLQHRADLRRLDAIDHQAQPLPGIGVLDGLGDLVQRQDRFAPRDAHPFHDVGQHLVGIILGRENTHRS